MVISVGEDSAAKGHRISINDTGWIGGFMFDNLVLKC